MNDPIPTNHAFEAAGPRRAVRRFFSAGFFTVVIALFLGSCSSAEHPEAIAGALDLRDWNFAENGTTDLSGDWMVYWEQLLDPSDIEEGMGGMPRSFTMPHTWNGWEFDGEEVGGEGYATFVLDVLLPEDLDRIAFSVPNASTAYALWADGKKAAASGKPGTTRETSIPFYRVSTADIEVSGGRVALCLQVSNFHHRRGGMWKPIRIGTPVQIEAYDTVETVYDLLLLGSFLALGIYNVLLFVSSGRKSVSNVLLGAMFLVLVVRVFVIGQMMITRMIPGFSWVWQLKIEYFTSHAVPFLILWSAVHLSPGRISRRFAFVVSGFIAVNTLAMIVTPVRFYSEWILWYLLGIIGVLGYIVLRYIIAFFRGDRWALAVALAVTIMLLIVAGETSHYREWVLSRDFTPFSAVIGLFSQGHRYNAHAYYWSIGITLAVMFFAMNFLVMAASRFTLQYSNRRGEDPSTLLSRYGLTRRETEIVELVINGLSNKEIGAKLFISDATVRNHLYSAMRKMDCRNRTEVATRVHEIKRESDEPLE